MSSRQMINALQSKVARIGAPLVLSAFAAACASVDDRIVDSCNVRGGSFNLMGLVAYQRDDTFSKPCDEGRDIATLATARQSDGSPDYYGAVLAYATIMEKTPEIETQYEAWLKKRGFTPNIIKSAAEKVMAEARRGVLVCKPVPDSSGASTSAKACSFEQAATGAQLPATSAAQATAILRSLHQPSATDEPGAKPR